MTLSAKRLQEFKAELIGTKVGASDSTLKKIEQLFPLPGNYRKALVKIGGGIHPVIVTFSPLINA